MHNRVEMNWIGGRHVFQLDIGHLRALQTSRDAGPEQILAAINDGSWRMDDLWDTCRFGLAGGGMDQDEADRLMEGLMAKHPLLAFKLPAQAILVAALAGVEDDQVGKPEGTEDVPESGNSHDSTDPAQ